MNKFVLASASPRRRELLENIGMEFDILVPATDESVIDRSIAPDMLVKELSMLKAAEAAKYTKKDCYIISADTVVVYNGQVLEKPKNSEEAEEMLRILLINMFLVERFPRSFAMLETTISLSR